MRRAFSSWRFRPLPRFVPALVPLLFAACKLTEVTVAPGARSVVVQSVLSRHSSDQFVIVEYSLVGDTLPGPTGDSIPPDSPKFPIHGATVVIHHLSGPCAGRVDVLAEQPVVTPGAVASGIYSGPLCPSAPGDRLALRVTTPDGEVVTGTTTMPGASARDVRIGSAPGAAAGDTLLLDRQRDTLKIGITPIVARGMQIEVRPRMDYEHRGRNVLYAITDTLGIAVPGDLVDPFEGDSGRTIFRAGRYYTLAVALADSNYWDFVRSRTDPITGSGFLNHLTGGIGVFGAVETTRYIMRVTAPQTDAREGVYRLTGTLGTTDLDLTCDFYLDDLDTGAFSAFLDGQWVAGPLHSSGDGRFWPDPNRLVLQFETGSAADSTLMAYTLSGQRPDDHSPFRVQLDGQGSTGSQVQTTLTGQQVSWP
jgi:hypothetical protein